MHVRLAVDSLVAAAAAALALIAILVTVTGLILLYNN